MKQIYSMTPTVLLVCVGSVVSSCSLLEDPDYSAQYITLPSGVQAYCNRQGYREVSRGNYDGYEWSYEPSERLPKGAILVHDQEGRFLECDVKVGPRWDSIRTDENGDLLTRERRMELREIQRSEREREAQKDREERQREREAAAAQRKAENLARQQKKERFERREAEILDRFDKAREQCNSEYDAAYAHYMEAPSQERSAPLAALREKAGKCADAADDIRSAALEQAKSERDGT